VLYAMISPARDVMCLSSAGHPPPVLAAPGQPGWFLDLPADPPLGIGRLARHRRCSTVDVAVGATIVCYTDGLVERRRQVIDDGLHRLRACVTASAAEDVCATIMAEMGVEQPTDDAAVLVLRRTAATSAGAAEPAPGRSAPA
jgi:phosphoserine phosphatase RsbU/P